MSAIIINFFVITPILKEQIKTKSSEKMFEGIKLTLIFKENIQYGDQHTNLTNSKNIIRIFVTDS
ncbi:MAG: hypothetical protein ABI855_09710 [Bacteroidota bacterium]